MSKSNHFPWITTSICAISVALFAVARSGLDLPSVTGGGPVDLSNALHVVGLGARSTPLVAHAHESWRLITCHFVHTSTLHLAFNLVFLFSVGGALEQVTRRLDYLALLLFCASSSALASLLGTPQVSAGSSGLVFGVLGAAVALGLRHRERFGQQVQPYFGVWVLPFLVIILAIGIGNPMVDHASHLGGLVAGVAVGVTLEPIRGAGAGGYRHAAIGAGILTVAFAVLAPAIASKGQGSTHYPTETGCTVAVPTLWTPRFGPLGEIEFVTAGGTVVLATDRAPRNSASMQRAWYGEHRLAPLEPARRAEDLEIVATRSVETDHMHGHMVAYRLRRVDIPMVRRVYFLNAGSPHRASTVISFETPATWSSKFDETLDAIIESVRAPAASNGRKVPPTMSAAALQ